MSSFATTLKTSAPTACGRCNTLTTRCVIVWHGPTRWSVTWLCGCRA